jgi:hypothetical protein
MSNLEEAYIKRLMQVTTICLVIGALLGIITYEFIFAGPTRNFLQTQLDQQTLISTKLLENSYHKLYLVYPPNSKYIMLGAEYELDTLGFFDVKTHMLHSEGLKCAEAISRYAAIDNTTLLFYPGTIALEKPMIVKGSNVSFYATEEFKTIFLPTPDYNNYTLASPLMVYGEHFTVSGLDASAFFRTYKPVFP